MHIKLILLSLMLVLASGHDNDDDDDSAPGTLPFYDVDDMIVGGGVGGLNAAAFLVRAKLLQGIAKAQISVALFEREAEVGGNVKRFKLVKPAGYDGSFGAELYADGGPARYATHSLGLERRLIIQYGEPTECTPWQNNFNARGRSAKCANPNDLVAGSIGEPFPATGTPAEQADSVANFAFAYGDGCSYDSTFTDATTGAYVGLYDETTYPSAPNTLVRDPALNYYSDYLLAGGVFKIGADEPDIGGAYDWGGDHCVHPITGVVTTVASGNCPFARSIKGSDDYKTFAARMTAVPGGAALNYNYSSFLQMDNVGFYRDYENGNGAGSYGDYTLREWGQTNNVYCYPMNGMYGVMLRMKAEFVAGGGALFLGERVKEVNDAPTGSNYQFIVRTTKRIVRVRKFLFMNTPAWHLYAKSPNDANTRWGGHGLNGTVVDALRAVPEVKQPQPHLVYKIVMQWPPGKRAWFWKYFDLQTGNFSVRQVGDTGCFSRTEFYSTRANLCKNVVVPVYTDYLCQGIWEKYIAEAEQTGNKALLTERLLVEMRASFPDVTAAEMGQPVLVEASRFPSGWYWGQRRYNQIENYQVTRKAAQPLGAKPVCLVGGGYAQSFQGWWEEPLRTVKRCLLTRLKTRIPKLQKVYDDLFAILPGFDGGVSDFSFLSSAGIIPPVYAPGTVPSQYAPGSEHWWNFISATKPGLASQDFCKARNYPAPTYTAAPI